MSEVQASRSFTIIRDMILADRPIVYVQTSEEDRLYRLLEQLAGELYGGKTALFAWSITEGLLQNGQQARTQPNSARAVLDAVIDHEGPALFMLKDFHSFIEPSAEIRRRLRDVYHACGGQQKHVVICSPLKVIPEDIEREVAYCTLPLPDVNELESLLRREAEHMAGGAAADDETVYTLTRALQGLSFNEARHAIRFAVAEQGKLDVSVLPRLQEEKRQLVRKTGLMEFVPHPGDLDGMGGLDVLKKWLQERRHLFYSRESISEEIVPKGMLLMGVSGCGKSLSARVAASVFGVPLYRVDMSQIFAAGLGNAERLFADACRTMEEIAPAVVWFDEIENSISRQHADSSGVLDRIFGYFLTWMQEKPTGLFVSATANRIDLLPAEMIRKGRFDQVFFIDLPDAREREEIFRIHLSRRHVDPESLSLELLTKRTEGWTGAEIEQAVISGLTSARIADKPLSDDYLFPSLREIVPLSKTMQEQVAHIRKWAFDRAVRASARK